LLAASIRAREGGDDAIKKRPKLLDVVQVDAFGSDVFAGGRSDVIGVSRAISSWSAIGVGNGYSGQALARP
jgi:hypothetical protein